ncbi:MAG: PAS domain S-box protein [Pyrinomonadaceae bacterium]
MTAHDQPLTGYEQQLRDMNAELLISSVRQHELTERWEKAEGLLRQSEEQFRLGITNSPIPVIMHAEDGEVLTVSLSWTLLTGYTVEDADVIQTWLTEAYGYGGDCVRDAMHDRFLPPVNRNEPMDAVVCEIVTREGDVRTWSFNASVPGLLSDGRRFVVGMVEDITDRIRAEAALRVQKRLLEALTESVLDGILIVSPDGRMLHHNQHFVDIWNFPPEVIAARSDEVALRWAAGQTSDPSAFLSRVTEIYLQPNMRFREEMPMKDGRVYERFGAPIHDEDKRLGWVWTFRDITERKRAETVLARHSDELEATVKARTVELRQTNRGLKAEIRERRRLETERLSLLAAITTVQEDERRRMALDLHDHFGQQLTALRFRLEILGIRGYADEQFQQIVAETQTLVRQIDEDVDSLSWDLRPPSLDDIGLAASLSDYVREWARRFQIPVHFQARRFGSKRIPPDSETHIYRITQEILTNIYKHAGATLVDISLEKRQGVAILTVTDDGVGFLPKARKSKPVGSGGLGLVGMRERAAIVGGTISIESVPEAGTTITLRVPVRVTRKREKNGQ